jgi:hypothetical protein
MSELLSGPKVNSADPTVTLASVTCAWRPLEVKVPFERKNSTALAHELVIDTVPSDSRTRKTRSEYRFVLRRVGAEALVLGKLMNIEVFGIELGMLDARVEESWVGEERVPVGFVDDAVFELEATLIDCGEWLTQSTSPIPKEQLTSRLGFQALSVASSMPNSVQIAKHVSPETMVYVFVQAVGVADDEAEIVEDGGDVRSEEKVPA